MASVRTQVYLTILQRSRLDELTKRQSRPMAEIVRDALDAYLGQALPDAGAALEGSFGAAPDLRVPSRDEWDRG